MVDQLTEIACELIALRDDMHAMLADIVQDLPPKGNTRNITTGAIGVESVVPFVVEAGASFVIAISTTVTLRLIGIDGANIATFGYGSVPNIRKFTTTEEIASIGITSIGANTRVAMWLI